MIPLKLTLKNFLCYGDSAPTLDLEGLHVVCLCGLNGHGKSALLDAVTWALWGKARGNSHDDLVHFGRDEMLVDLEFSARDSRYRVVRRRSIAGGRTRAGSSDLQLLARDGDSFRPITGNTIRGTQDEIDRITGMDYDTFINSAFLLQGRADEFANKSPGERKEVLAKILDLAYYDRLQERARQLRIQKRSAAGAVQDVLDSMGREVAASDGLRSDLEAVELDLQVVAGEMESRRKSRDGLRDQVAGLRTLGMELEGLRKRVPDMEGEIVSLEKEARDRQKRIDGYREVIGRRGEVEAGLVKLGTVRTRYEEMNRAQEQMTRAREQRDELVGRKSKLEERIYRESAALEERARGLESRIEADLRPKVAAAPDIEADLKAQQGRLDGLAEKEHEVEQGRRKVQDLAASTGKLRAAAEALQKEGEEIRDKLELVQRSPQDAVCPLCGTELGPEGCQRLSHSYDQQIRLKRDEYRTNKESMEASESERARLEAEVSRLEGWLRGEWEQAQQAVATRKREIEDARSAALKLEQDSREMTDLRRQLLEGRFAQEERRESEALQQELEALQREVDNLGYDSETHEALYREMQGLGRFRQDHVLLMAALDSLPAEEESMRLGLERLSRLREELAGAKERLEAKAAEMKALPELEAKLESEEGEVRRLEARHTDLTRRQGELQAHIRRVADMERQMNEKRSLLRSLKEDEGIYRDLTNAFGKGGIQAMLIETALPQVEEEANVLLGRMTDSRMHVKLETQRQRRTGHGEPIETLEIRISDELGPRSYEMFSGGEAFRVNLALRIALSKVLAHRKGAPLPTLFIDEGFGTQDAQGRERVLDVINAIQQDFQKIIVITHLEDLKDAFQAKIEVQKGEDGSTFWVSSY